VPAHVTPPAHERAQIFTSTVASFAHGANDCANAAGPLSVIYNVWHDGTVPKAKSSVDLWVLGFVGAWIVIGAWGVGRGGGCDDGSAHGRGA
jgi:phosphate/sulfate permease